MRAALAILTLSTAAACSGQSLDAGRDAGGPAAAGSSGWGGASGGSTGSAGAAGAAATAGSTGSAGAGSEGSIIEWSIPFADSQPFQIAASGTTVFYLNAGADQMLGRLDTQNDTVTEWPLSVPATSPGDIQVRPSDGAVFFTSATVGELGQLDPRASSS